MKLIKPLILAAFLTSVICIGAASPAYADELSEARAILDENLPGTLMHNPYDIRWSASGPDKRTKIVDAEGAPGGKAYQIRVKKKQMRTWEINIAIQLDSEANIGDEIVLHFWARTVKPAKGFETAKITALVQRNTDPYDAIITQGFSPTQDWAIYTAKGVATKNYGVDSLQASFQVADHAQTVEFGQFYVSNLGQ
ncbi:hypothetical protein [Robiginitomaculum antarcticum]|uniref:hypothetical protein n=1 Tax=Robiginitomaculum antarcticum TaxID=437507 RepID=UPI00039E47DE|nr:hypothetical protein [Robiginitomaculum antarcticum]